MFWVPVAPAIAASTSGSSCCPVPRRRTSQEADSHSHACSRACSPSGEDEQTCWVCLAGAEEGPLLTPCKCPRLCHQRCLSRWQLQQAGRTEERSCRFCFAQLPDWREAHASMRKASPIFTIVYEGTVHSLPVHPGEAGRKEFLAAVRRIYNLGEDDEVHLSFGCKDAFGSGDIMLDGAEQYDSAVHLASISAGKRKAEAAARQQQEQHAAEQGAAAGLQGGSSYSSPRSVISAVKSLFRS